MPGHAEISESVLSVEELTVRIGHPATEVVTGFGFDIGMGEIVGLAGESGSGKSVTALAITRLATARSGARYSGNVRLKGEPGNLLHLPERRLRNIRGRQIGYVFQEPSASFNPLFPIGAHLREVLHRHLPGKKDKEALLHHALEEVGIPADREHLMAYPSQFSGGMLQRVAIACALIARPGLLIADEPTTALDTTTQKRISDLLLRLNSEYGMAILFISHNLGLLKEITSRLLVMKEGTLVEHGPTGEVLHAPQSEYTRNLVETAPKLRLY